LSPDILEQEQQQPTPSSERSHRTLLRDNDTLDETVEEDAAPPAPSTASEPQRNGKTSVGIEPGGLTPGAYQIQPRGPRRGPIPIRDLPLSASDRCFVSTMNLNVSQDPSRAQNTVNEGAAPDGTIPPTMSE
jgi:hypothetical protein